MTQKKTPTTSKLKNNYSFCFKGKDGIKKSDFLMRLKHLKIALFYGCVNCCIMLSFKNRLLFGVVRNSQIPRPPTPQSLPASPNNLFGRRRKLLSAPTIYCLLSGAIRNSQIPRPPTPQGLPASPKTFWVGNRRTLATLTINRRPGLSVMPDGNKFEGWVVGPREY